MAHFFQPLSFFGLTDCEDTAKKRTPVDLNAGATDQGGDNYKMGVGGFPFISASLLKFSTSCATSIEFNFTGAWPNSDGDYVISVNVDGVDVVVWESDYVDGDPDPKAFTKSHTANLVPNACGHPIEVSVIRQTVETSAVFTDLEMIIT